MLKVDNWHKCSLFQMRKYHNHILGTYQTAWSRSRTITVLNNCTCTSTMCICCYVATHTLELVACVFKSYTFSTSARKLSHSLKQGARSIRGHAIHEWPLQSILELPNASCPSICPHTFTVENHMCKGNIVRAVLSLSLGARSLLN